MIELDSAGLLAKLAELPLRQQASILNSIEGRPNLTDKDRLVASAYIATGDVSKAAKEAGVSKYVVNSTLNKPAVRQDVEQTITELEEKSKLSAQYVMTYMWDVLEFCPTDFFVPADDGGWLIDPVSYTQLPRDVKRLIESIEIKQIRGSRFMSMTFVSKSQVLAIAARYVLTQKVHATVSAVPWDSLMLPPVVDTVQQRMDKLLEAPDARRGSDPVREDDVAGE